VFALFRDLTLGTWPCRSSPRSNESPALLDLAYWLNSYINDLLEPRPWLFSSDVDARDRLSVGTRPCGAFAVASGSTGETIMYAIPDGPGGRIMQQELLRDARGYSLDGRDFFRGVPDLVRFYTRVPYAVVHGNPHLLAAPTEAELTAPDVEARLPTKWLLLPRRVRAALVPVNLRFLAGWDFWGRVGVWGGAVLVTRAILPSFMFYFLFFLALFLCLFSLWHQVALQSAPRRAGRRAE
jgi:hypothetical protein